MPSLLAQASWITPDQHLLMLMASAATGLAAAWLLRAAIDVVDRPAVAVSAAWQFEQARKARLRQVSRTYRWFEPLIDELATVRPLQQLGGLPQVRRALAAGGVRAPWTAEEYVGLIAFQALGVALVVGWLGQRFVAPATAAVLALTAFVWFVRRGAGRVIRGARVRMQRLKRRLPFGIDLIALMMEAGAGFRDGLATVARECRDHPLGEEFDQVQQSLARGQTLREALERMQQRLHEEDVNELVFAVTKAEALGTPLSKVFLSLAEQMRLKRVQWAEKAAGEAQAMIIFPGILVMLACILAIVAPFILSAYADYAVR